MSDDSSEDKAKKPSHSAVDSPQDATQPMPVDVRPSSPRPTSDPSETATWTPSPPPLIIDGEEEEEEETVVSAIPASPEPPTDDFETLIAPMSVKAPPSSAVAPSASLRPMLLERIEPSLGRGERLRLDTAHWQVSLGRAEESDIRLYTASASREHAAIAGNSSGDWVLTPETGKRVLIDGDRVAEPVVLEVGMNIVLGQDHLRCVDEGLEGGGAASDTVADGFKASAEGGVRRMAIAGIFLGTVTLIGLAWAFFALRGD